MTSRSFLRRDSSADRQIPDSVPISSQLWLNIDELMEVMWEKLNLVRVYTKPRGQAPDYSSPVVLRRGKCTVEHFCNAIHKDIAKQFKNGSFNLPRALRACTFRR